MWGLVESSPDGPGLKQIVWRIRYEHHLCPPEPPSVRSGYRRCRRCRRGVQLRPDPDDQPAEHAGAFLTRGPAPWAVTALRTRQKRALNAAVHQLASWHPTALGDLRGPCHAADQQAGTQERWRACVDRMETAETGQREGSRSAWQATGTWQAWPPPDRITVCRMGKMHR